MNIKNYKLVQRFRNDDPTVVKATLASLTLADNVQQDHAAAASRAGRQAAQQDLTDPPPPVSIHG